MKSEFKEMINGKWVTAEYDTMCGKTSLEWIADNMNRVVSVIYTHGKAGIIITNNDIDYEIYNKKSIVLDEQGEIDHLKFTVLKAFEAQKLLGSEILPKVVIDILPGGKLIEMRTL